MDMEQELTGRHYMDGYSDGVQWAQGEPVARFVVDRMGCTISDSDFEVDAYLTVNGDFASTADRIAYATALADRLNIAAPKAAPLMPDQLADRCESWIQAGGASNIVDAFEAGYRDAERVHGITAQGEE